MAQEDLLKSIDTKLSALLAITLDQYLRDTGVAKARHPSVDTMLRAAGVSAKDIAALLGKTERAVHMVWQADDEAKAAKKKSRGKKTGPTS